MCLSLFRDENERAFTSQIFSQHPNEKLPKRDDGYWRAYITRAGESTAMQVRKFNVINHMSHVDLWTNKISWQQETYSEV